jgi:hypothetical protein
LVIHIARVRSTSSASNCGASPAKTLAWPVFTNSSTAASVPRRMAGMSTVFGTR